MTEKEQLQQYKHQIENMQKELNRLSVQIDKFTQNSETVVEHKTTISNDANKVQTVLSVPIAQNRNQQKNTIKYEAMESLIGKNLFAILASLLILIGVSIFISTIYNYIPEILKIVFIYLFGFAMLGVGLGIYKKNENKFWLAVGSCGLAELLVAIIASHSYFKILSLPITYLFILIWIIGSFKLTKIQPVLFKTIGYIGFMVSMTLGLSLLTDNDMISYISLFVSYAILSIFFMISNKELEKINSIISICSTLGIWFFVDFDYYIQTIPNQVSVIPILILIILFNIIHATKNNTLKKGYTIQSIISMFLFRAFIGYFTEEIALPFILLCLCCLYLMNEKHGDTNLYNIFVCILLLCIADEFSTTTIKLYHYWFVLFSIISYGYYYFNKTLGLAWVGFISFLSFVFLYVDTMSFARYEAIILMLLAISIIILLHTNKLKQNSLLEIAWYFVFMALVIGVVNDSCVLITEYYAFDNWKLEWLIDDYKTAILVLIYSILNTAYLHLIIQDKKYSNIRWIILIVQAILLAQSFDVLDYDTSICFVFGLLSSLLIVLYSASYTINTKGEKKWLVLWQFIKFALYIITVFSIWETPTIIANICLLILAITAIVLGFKIQNRSIRLYGLIVSFINVISIVFSNVEWSNSLQLSFGIIICGLLCFGISFIYYKVSKHFEGQEIISE